MMNRRTVLLSLPALWPLTQSSLAQTIKPYRISLSAGTLSHNQYQAGLLINLSGGWKTYWRMPGEAGIPPDFNWQKSKNLKEIKVFYPRPNRFHGGDGETIGYKGDVFFPLLVTPADLTAPVYLDLSLSFAVCEKVCVPAHGEAQATLPGAPQADVEIAAWQARVPEVLKPGQQPIVQGARFEQRDGQLFLVLTLNQQSQDIQDIYVESDAAYFRQPQFSTPLEAWLAIDNLTDPAKLAGQSLNLTFLMKDQAKEEPLQLP